jgi:hypothetical protein
VWRDTASVSEGKRWNGACISLTLVVRLPRLDDRAGDRRAAGVAHVSLDIHVLALPLGRDRLAERDCRWNMVCVVGSQHRGLRLGPFAQKRK